jgi:hypothetical protein
MLVEDHDLIREALAALQAEPDIEVVACCPDGQTAIENADRASPDVAVTDLSLPGLMVSRSPPTCVGIVPACRSWCSPRRHTDTGPRRPGPPAPTPSSARAPTPAP